MILITPSGLPPVCSAGEEIGGGATITVDFTGARVQARASAKRKAVDSFNQLIHIRKGGLSTVSDGYRTRYPTQPNDL